MSDTMPSSDIPITETVLQRLIEVIKRQTDYDDDTVKKKLVEHNNNVVDIIREFMNPGNKPLKPNKMLFSQLVNELKKGEAGLL